MRKKNDKRAERKVGPVLHIFCEGEKTEPNYIDRYKSLNSLGKSIKLERTPKNTPVQLVQVAVKSKRANTASKEDEYWVVYDRESPAKYDESLHARARNIAEANGVRIALSNVCFEVWLLLHKQPTCAACNSCDELMAREDFCNAFKDYHKGDGCTLTLEEISSARRNASAMNERTESGADRNWTVPSKWNPYTDVYKLLDAIDAFVGNHKEET